MNQQLPSAGYVRLPQIIGQEEVTEAQAKANRELGKGPKRPRRAIPAVIPVCKSTWWAGIKSGRYPAPSKPFGSAIAAWKVEDILAIIGKGVAA